MEKNGKVLMFDDIIKKMTDCPDRTYLVFGRKNEIKDGNGTIYL